LGLGKKWKSKRDFAALDRWAVWAACRRRRQSRPTPKVLGGLVG
jgi:hypothetical protein